MLSNTSILISFSLFVSFVFSYPEMVKDVLNVKTVFRPEICDVVSKMGDKLIMHYNGSVDESSTNRARGKLLSSSITDRKPFKFILGEEEWVKGWEKGLVGMCIGEKRSLIVPPDMTFAEEAKNEGVILRFDVELVDINPPDEVIDLSQFPDFKVENITISEQCDRRLAKLDMMKVLIKAVIDSSSKVGTPDSVLYDAFKEANPYEVQIGNDKLVKGLEIGLLGMCPGEKRSIVVPPELGYGELGMPRQKIPGDATIKFTVEVISIRDPDPRPPIDLNHLDSMYTPTDEL